MTSVLLLSDSPILEFSDCMFESVVRFFVFGEALMAFCNLNPHTSSNLQLRHVERQTENMENKHLFYLPKTMGNVSLPFIFHRWQIDNKTLPDAML